MAKKVDRRPCASSSFEERKGGLDIICIHISWLRFSKKICNLSETPTEKLGLFSILKMKIHPVPKKRNITFRYDIASALSQNLQKKLRRLPHIFAKVLELPFHSDADVLVQETSDSMRFVVTTDDDIGDDITAHPIEIYPGVTKIVVRGTNVLDLSMDELELDVWRFRLPAATRPELVSAAYIDGELVVTVPKGDNSDEEDGDNQEQILGEGNGRLVLVHSRHL